MLSIVIPTSNAEDTIGELLESIKAQDFHDDYEVIIIDNGSKDKTEEIVKKYIDHLPIRYYKYEEKLGHAGAINEGISKAKGEYILILHDDLVLGDRDWISVMLETVKKDERIGIASSLFITPVKKLRSTVNKIFSYIYILGWHDKVPNLPIMEVLYSGLNNDLIRREVIEKVGLLDNSYKYGMHDIDFAERVRRAGYKIILNPKVHVEHLLSYYQKSLKSHLFKAWQYGFPSAIILKRYKYLPNLDNLIYFLSVFFFLLSFFLPFYPLLFFVILLSLLTFPLEQPNFYKKNKYVIRAKKIAIGYLLGAIAYLIFHPLFFLAIGGSVILYRTVTSALISYKELRNLKVTLGVILLYPIWTLINGSSVLSGILKFIFTK